MSLVLIGVCDLMYLDSIGIEHVERAEECQVVEQDCSSALNVANGNGMGMGMEKRTMGVGMGSRTAHECAVSIRHPHCCVGLPSVQPRSILVYPCGSSTSLNYREYAAHREF